LRFDIRSGDAVIVGCGATVAAKGFDLLPMVLKNLNTRYRRGRVHAVWIGPINEQSSSPVVLDAERFGLADLLHLTGETADPSKFIGLGDVFVLPSREESLSLVVLEAAQFGLPTVCFDDAGGAPEFARDNAGLVVPYLDVEAFSNAVFELLSDREVRARLGRNAREKVALQFTIDHQAPRFVQVLSETAG
jgi:glycosyltransferase involved in cell wall biosynthesis